MDITLEQLKTIMPLAGHNADKFLDAVNVAMKEFSINTPKRQAAFLAQLAHESGQFRYVEELASGAAYDVGSLAKRLGNTLEDDGDGERLKGRGLIQITGHDNYLACSLALFNDDRLLQFPELLEDTVNASRSAAWYWSKHGLNDLADVGTEASFITITKRINGGINGLKERQAFYNTARKVLGVL